MPVSAITANTDTNHIIQTTSKKTTEDDINIWENASETEVKNINQNKTGEYSDEDLTVCEGAKLVGKGFLNKAKNTLSSIVKHPLKTLAIAAGTTATLSALPLIGISSVTGAAILTLGFAGCAVIKTGKDVFEAVDNAKEGDNANLRKDLENIGGDCLDLALSLPFAPKAVKQVSRAIKYTSGVGLNTGLINNIKTAKGAGGKFLELLKGDVKINYETVANEMGLKTKPDLVFSKIPMNQSGSFDPVSGNINFNENRLLLPGTGKTNESLLRHELEHFLQYSDVARLKGADGLKNIMGEYYSGVVNELGDNPWAYESGGMSLEVAQNMASGDKSAFNSTFWEDIVKTSGTIDKASANAMAAETYARGILEKVTPNADAQNAFNLATAGLNPETNALDAIKYNKAKLALYKANPLEEGAYAAQEVYEKQIQNARPGFLTSTLQTLKIGANSNEEK